MEMSRVRARRSRETSPDQDRVHMQPRIRPFRKVQIIYYLCRNGQLEHPHFMEVSHLPNQQLRLKDVMDRLTLLRGRGMPSLYSWSCKRSYKNGYVWNDLAENDVIHPAEGAEYILKGSEIIEGCTDQIQHLQLSTHRRKATPMTSQNRHHHHHHHEEEEDAEEMEEEEEDDEEEEEAGDDNIGQEEVEDKGPQHHTCSSSNTPSSRCSRGVATEELDLTHHQPTDIRLDNNTSPPSSSSSDKPNASITTTTKPSTDAGGSNRLDDVVDSDQGPITRTPSVLLQLIACGSAAVKGRTGLLMKNSASPSSSSPCSNHGVGNSGRKSGVSLHRGVLCRLAATRAVEDEEEENEINYMSENPRFGNPQLEEKEYFSGSIVEAMGTGTRVAASEPSLKKSSSYNEERSTKCGIGEVGEETMEEKRVKGKCIPSRKRSVFKLQQQQQSKK